MSDLMSFFVEWGRVNACKLSLTNGSSVIRVIMSFIIAVQAQSLVMFHEGGIDNVTLSILFLFPLTSLLSCFSFFYSLFVSLFSNTLYKRLFGIQTERSVIWRRLIKRYSIWAELLLSKIVTFTNFVVDFSSFVHLDNESTQVKTSDAGSCRISLDVGISRHDIDLTRIPIDSDFQRIQYWFRNSTSRDPSVRMFVLGGNITVQIKETQ